MTIDPKTGRAGFERAGFKPAPTNNPNPPVGAGLKPAHSPQGNINSGGNGITIDPATGRRSIRLKEYDYAHEGAYFITICTVRAHVAGAGLKPAHSDNPTRAHLFGAVINGKMRLNEYGEMVQDAWRGLPLHYPHVVLDEFAIMPNHVHAIIILSDDDIARAGFKPAPANNPNPPVGAGLKPAHSDSPARMKRRHGLPEIVRAFKTFSARHINERRHAAGAGVWQRNYFEHVIRDDTSLNLIRQYIVDNPLQWESDRENHEGKPGGTSPSPDEPWRIL